MLAASVFAPGHNNHCPTQHQFEQFSAKVWSPSKWQKKSPRSSTLEAAQKAINCPQHRKGLERIWKEARTKFYAKRHAMVDLIRRKPFVYPSGKRWAVPYPIALCESGENYYVGPYGAYGLILEREWMSPREQDLAAGRLYAESGEAPWAPFESECAYR